MSRPTEIEYQGRTLQGRAMDFHPVKEDWNTYRLEDGTLVKVRVIPSDFVVTEKKNAMGDPLIVVKASTIVACEPKKPEKRNASRSRRK